MLLWVIKNAEEGPDYSLKTPKLDHLHCFQSEGVQGVMEEDVLLHAQVTLQLSDFRRCESRAK